MLVVASHATAATSLTYVYDANGNLINGDGRYYEYNDANQLVKVRFGDQNGPLIAEYFYDYIGQRIKKVENGIVTYYIGKHYEEVRDGTDIKKTEYYFANGERVAKKDPLGNMYYYHSDHLGGTNVMTDSGGNLVERTKYYPFGEIREGGSEKYSFTGKEKDKQTDFYYFEARYYDSDFKHFTQADTVEPDYYDPQDLNRYAYVRNNPINLIDPTGRSFVDSLINRASNTRVGNWLGDKMLHLMVDSSIKNASPQVQASYYSELANGLGHTYDVTKEATGTAMSAVVSLYTDGPEGPINDFYKLTVMLAEEAGYDKNTTKYLRTFGDIADLMSMKQDVKALGKNFHFSRQTYNRLVKDMGQEQYSKMLRLINDNKLHDAYKIIKTIKDSGDIANENIRRYRR